MGATPLRCPRAAPQVAVRTLLRLACHAPRRGERLRNEAHLPTKHPQAGQDPWLPQAHVDPSRPLHLEVTAPQGPPPPHRLSCWCLLARSDEFGLALPLANCSVHGLALAVAPSGPPSWPPTPGFRVSS